MRHQLPGAAREEPVRLRVVDLTAGDGACDRLEICGIHLVVAGHHARDVDPLFERAAVAREDGGADALVALVRDDLDPRIAGTARALGRLVAGGVVDHEDAVDEVGDAAQRRPDQPFLVERRHDDGDALPVEHYLRPVRATIGSQKSAARMPRMSPIRPATASRVPRAPRSRLAR